MKSRGRCLEYKLVCLASSYAFLSTVGVLLSLVYLHGQLALALVGSIGVHFGARG